MTDNRKRIYKKKGIENKSADGTENAEHILDISQEIDMLYSNIKSNTDVSIELYKFKKANEESEDILDAIQIACEKIIELEKSASELYADYGAIAKQLDIKYEDNLKEIYQNMRILEENSRKTLESILN